ncbi:D-alanyl-D-alanine carboxypeptidase [Candidatus Peregrinibacteria bacterium]|nr:D-alanyl-D-alanine carboxypeptidase [Candidatus Peregrinibacteria bacterium]
MILPPQETKIAYADLLDVAAIPYQKNEVVAPPLEARAINVLDLKTGTQLYSKNADEKKSIGSITKLITALIILEENDLTETVTISTRAAAAEGSTMWLRQGEKITVENLLYSMLIHSANDATYGLAEHNAGSIEKFVDKMNKKAQFMELKNTKFSNPAGFDDANNYSNANDIGTLSRIAYKKPFIRRVASIKNMEVRSINNTVHKLESTNNLLGLDPRVKGLKTGHTREAGFSFVSVATSERGNDIITVILDSPARFTETQKLIDWVFANFVW